ncbi:sigma-70 family RNA polymerase sigma factor [Thermopolyspora sp. NPDC052614]|uniref:sigma-70 family RNA polymerase sigma factor n=1 Tax=Thermopolyspora sp. NPDC052614 TaxID=3155682 RepID=UPI00341616C3
MMETQVRDDFLHLADPFRRELTAYCYRMLGSIHDAEDLVQETYLRAWRSYDKFEGRSSLRSWLYRIATNVCLTALESRGKRPMPTGLGTGSADPAIPVVEQVEVPWLEPAPDVMVGASNADPAAIVTSRESVRLALIAALQHLPPRQRAVLILRDVLKWRAAEVAELLDVSAAAVNSMLQRARAQLDEISPSEDEVAEPTTQDQRDLLNRYVEAFERYDVNAIVTLFTKDAVWEMPPFPTWYQGADSIGRLISAQCPAQRPGDLRLLPTEANGQPAFAMYLRRDGTYHSFAINVLTLSASGIEHGTMFFDLSLFPLFGLPDTLPQDA